MASPSSPLVSIVIPTLNESKYLSDCIAAINHQTYRNYEVIAVDKSTDDTPLLCKKAGWTVVTQKGKTISAARGEGFAVARGEIVASTDADSQPDPRWLESIVASLSRPEVAAVYGPTLFPSSIRFSGLLNSFGLLFIWSNRLAGHDHLVGMNFAVRKTYYTQIGGFNPALPTAEDVDLGYRLSKVGKIVYNSGVKVVTSPRRLLGQGPLKFITHHTKNYLRLMFTGRASSDFKPFR